MDWIERLFHFSPDAGSGIFELALAIFAGVVLAVLAVGALRAFAPKRRLKGSPEERSR